ncbi:MAG: sulfatase [Halieaceae bacterium]|nr:sulfatase [Halieaceae bacterium]MDG1932901.1 sulfatase [Luminiphilus sp.]MDG2038259.1 sulfatase [Luminiphilus sp.]|tara:strand:- start:2478 stop:4157 length:1680 start_codon:yes stop_codon:yes gene_type:complete
MQRIIASLTVVLIAAAGWGYLYPGAAILTGVKLRTQFFDEVVAPPRDIAWQSGPAVPAALAADRPPNIVLIVADDLGYNDISTFGGGVAGGQLQTPHIDALAEQGAVFTQSYSGSSTCAPSRAMLMTGRYPSRTGFAYTPMPPSMGRAISIVAADMDRTLPGTLYDAEAAANKPTYDLQGLPPEEVTLAELLKAHGYHTVHIGKWHLGRENGMAAHEQGFDESLLMASGLYLPEDHPNVVNAKLDFDPIDQFLWSALTFSNSYNSGDADRFEPAGYLTDYWTDESIKVIKSNRNRPFFLYLAHWGIHTPLQATRADYEAVGDIKPHRLRVYAAMTRALDRSVGRVMAALEEEGLAENTIVIFTSDNGGAGYVGLADVNAPYRGWKITHFEGGIRVPMFVKWPARIAAGQAIDTPVAHIDVMPTLLAAVEQPLPEDRDIDGENLLPLMSQGVAAQTEWSRQTLFWSSGHNRIVRHGDWKLQIAARPEKQWLFNLAEDPTEQVNLAGARPDKLSELMALLNAHAANSRAPLYEPEIEGAVAIDKHLALPFEPGDEWVSVPN